MQKSIVNKQYINEYFIHILYFMTSNSPPLVFEHLNHDCWGWIDGSKPYLSMNVWWTWVIIEIARSQVVLATSKMWLCNCNHATKSIKLSTTERLWSSMIRLWADCISICMTSKWGINIAWIEINVDLMLMSAVWSLTNVPWAFNKLL